MVRIITGIRKYQMDGHLSDGNISMRMGIDFKITFF
jgi:hypothetical protein